MTLSVGSLFSGIGGLDLGLERAGMTVRWQVENDPYCQRVLAKHWPDVPRYGDIKELDPHDLEPVDVVAGGFPCQPVSLAGRRRTTADGRWLWPNFAHVLRVVRPRFAMLENVPGLLTAGFDIVLGDLHELGFDAEWDIVPACAVGASHARERLFVVAYAGGVRRGTGRPEQPLSGTRMDGPPLVGWAPEPDVGRMVARIPRGLDLARRQRIKALGNAVVPQVAEYVGRRIVEAAA